MEIIKKNGDSLFYLPESMHYVDAFRLQGLPVFFSSWIGSVDCSVYGNVNRSLDDCVDGGIDYSVYMFFQTGVNSSVDCSVHGSVDCNVNRSLDDCVDGRIDCSVYMFFQTGVNSSVDFSVDCS